MSRAARVNFVRQQGFREADRPTCALRYPGLMFQPRLVGLLVAVGLLLQAGWLFLGLGAVLWWSALFPRGNPFEALYNTVIAGDGDRPPLPPSPPPRRFAMGMAGTFMLVIGIALLTGARAVARVAEGLLVVALAALIFGRFCLGSFLFHLFRGDAAFARRTAPWTPEEPEAG